MSTIDFLIMRLSSMNLIADVNRMWRCELGDTLKANNDVRKVFSSRKTYLKRHRRVITIFKRGD